MGLDRHRIPVFLAEEKRGRLATADARGRPHVVPMNYVILGGQIYFETSVTSKKARNLRANPEVAFCVDTHVPGEGQWGVLIQGRAEFVEEPALIGRFWDAFAQRYFGSSEHPSFKILRAFGHRLYARIVEEHVSLWDTSRVTARAPEP